MRAGPLRYSIELYSKTNTRDDYSGYSEAYTYQCNTRADVKYLGGTQQIVNDQIFPSSDVQFTIRYKSDLDETYRIKWRNEIYWIDNIQVMEPKRGLILRCSKALEM